MRGDLDRCNMTVTARSGTIHLTCDRSDGHDAEAFNGGFEDLAHYDLYQDASWMLLGGDLVVAYRTEDASFQVGRSLGQPRLNKSGTCACGSEGMTGQGSVVDLATLFKHTVVRCGHCCAHYEFPACCEPCARVEPWEATG